MYEGEASNLVIGNSLLIFESVSKSLTMAYFSNKIDFS